MKTSIFYKGQIKKNYIIRGQIFSNMDKREIEDILDLLGFSMFRVQTEEEWREEHK